MARPNSRTIGNAERHLPKLESEEKCSNGNDTLIRHDLDHLKFDRSEKYTQINELKKEIK